MGDSMGGRQLVMPGGGPSRGEGIKLSSEPMASSRQMSAAAPAVPPARSPGVSAASLMPELKGQRQMTVAAPAVPPVRGGRRLLLDAGVAPRRPGLDVKHMLETAAETGEREGNAAESATGGMGPAIIDLVKQTAERAASLLKAVISNRDGSVLIDLERRERLVTVEILRQQRAERLREATLRREGMSERVRRAQIQRERMQAAGRASPVGAAERRNRSTADSMRRTVDGGTLHGQRAPAAERGREAGVRSIADARRALPAPGATVQGQSRALSVLPRGMGPAPTGVARPMRLAPGAAPSPLRLAAPQTVNHWPSLPAPRTPGMGMGAQRGAGIAAMGQAMGRGR